MCLKGPCYPLLPKLLVDLPCLPREAGQGPETPGLVLGVDIVACSVTQACGTGRGPGSIVLVS